MGRLSLAAAILCILLTSCHTPRYIYSPAPPNNPYFEKKGDSKLSGYFSGDIASDKADYFNKGYDVQAAYAISNNWAITAGFFKRKERDTYNLNWSNYNIFDSSIIDYKRKLFEFGAGYFIPLNKRNTVSFNIYGGIGLGRFSFDDSGMDTGTVYSRSHSSRIFKWYVQPGFNFFTGRYFRFSLLGRLSFVSYHDILTSYNDAEKDYFRLNIIENRGLAFFEPTFNMQIGVPKCDWLKIDCGMTLCSDPEENYLEARSFCTYIGLSFDLSRIGKKK